MVNKEDIKESTGSGSSGSFETSFSFEEMYTNKKEEDDDEMVDLNEQQITEIIKNVLIEKFVYGTQAFKAGSLEGKKNHDVENNKLTDSNNFKQNEEIQTEREGNGLLDIKYDYISDKAKEQMQNAYTNGDNAIDKGIGNASYNSTIGKDSIERAKKRKKSIDDSTNLTQFGDDVEINSKKRKSINTMVENNTILYKQQIYDSKHFYETVKPKLLKSKKLNLKEDITYLLKDSQNNVFEFIIINNNKEKNILITETYNLKKLENGTTKVLRLIENNFEYNKTSSQNSSDSNTFFNNFLEENKKQSNAV